MKTLIYADEGVSPFILQETLKTFSPNATAIHHETLITTNWETETSLLIIPGGRDIPYDRKLRGPGVKKIRSFVEGGGNFLGICAGAYFGASRVLFEPGTPLEVDEKRELCFFPGTATGTLYPHAPFSYEENDGAHAAHLTYQNHDLHLYYNGGCAFEDAEDYPSVSVLARYKDATDQAAIIHCRVERGNAILSGVHFEVSPTSLKSEEHEPQLIKQLERSDKKRQQLIAFLMSKLTA